ncbi:MAG: hypothetical protein FVQ80_16345 [Planctomycetes bacterium]|nr:hypothetical protein [Planctomycetota bacterium]
MKFEEQGFLIYETHEIQKITKNAFADVFEICKELNTLAHRIRNSIKLDYDNELHIISVCLLQRILDSFQSTVILMETGLEADSNTITRSSLEALFILRKLCIDPHYIEKYLGYDQIQRKKLINIAKQDKKAFCGKPSLNRNWKKKCQKFCQIYSSTNSKTYTSKS